MTKTKDDPDHTAKPEQGKEGGGVNADSPHVATNDDPNGSPNPPTRKVPPEGVREPYRPDPQSGEIQESAPVWEGGDPGEAVQQDPATTGPDYVDTTYHPEDAEPEATAKSKKDAEDAAHIEKKKKDDFI